MRLFTIPSMIVLGLAGCGGSGDDFDQTWPKNYDQTTCEEWHSEMTPNEQRVAAADMLVGAQSADDPDVGLPDDSLIAEFRDDVTEACVIDTHTVAEVGAALYLMDPGYRP